MGFSRFAVLAVLATLLALPAQAAAAPEPRIINGTLPSQAWPAQVSLHHGFLISPSGYCAGTLVSARWVLTAGHCVTNNSGNERPPDDWNYTADAARSRVGSIARTERRHADHGRSGHPPRELQRHDARSRPRAAAPRVGRARGAAAADRQRRRPSLWGPGVQATVIGWGVTETGFQNNSQLLEAKMPMLSDATCAGPPPTGWASEFTRDVDGVRRRRRHRHVPRRLRRAAHDAARRPLRARRRDVLRDRPVRRGELPERREPGTSRASTRGSAPRRSTRGCEPGSRRSPSRPRRPPRSPASRPR